MTREARGRRVDPREPAQRACSSPSRPWPRRTRAAKSSIPAHARIPHSRRVDRERSPAPSNEDAAVVSISVDPPLSILKNGAKQRFLVTAHYDDGSSLDVTDWAKFASADETVALIDEDRLRRGHRLRRRGRDRPLREQGDDRADPFHPFPNSIPADVFTRGTKTNFIDDLVLAQLAQLNLQPSGRCSDEDFIRRAYLDTIENSHRRRDPRLSRRHRT